MLSITLLLYREDIAGLPVNTVGYVLLYIAAILTLWTMVNYLRSAALTQSGKIMNPFADLA
jgi:phosphatidylglycerophosphate synthase